MGLLVVGLQRSLAWRSKPFARLFGVSDQLLPDDYEGYAGGPAARPDSSRNPPPRKKTVPRSGPLPNSR
jgi:hypothetical protein